MKAADMEKMMAAVVKNVEKKYPGVKATVKANEWQKGDYHRLYINLFLTAEVNGEEKVKKVDFGFINLETNRYNTKGSYDDMRHFNADEFAPAKMLYEYAQAYEAAESDNTRYVAKDGYRHTVGLSEEEQAKGVSRKEMLDKSFEAWILPSSFDTFWTAAGEVEVHEESEAHEEKEETTEDTTEIGSYDGHSVTVRLAKSGKYIVEDDGEDTMDDGKTRGDGIYEAAMYLYDRLAEDGKTIKVKNNDAYDYIVECAEGMKVKIIKNEDGTIRKEG